LEGVCRVVFRNHYRVALVAELDPVNAVRSLSDGRLDGVIWCRLVRDDKAFEIMKRSPIPVVVLAVPPAVDLGCVHFVYCDNDGGMEGAVDHLWNLGHRRIMFLRESREENASDCQDRLEGLRTAMRKRGAELAEDDVVSWSWDLDELEGWWAGKPKHTAVIGWSERAAGRFLDRCLELSIRVPEELSVVGFDSTRYCYTTTPPLTSVRQPITELADYATRVLLDLIDGKAVDPNHPKMPCPLDIRASTGAPSAST
jgi:LacI family transcriptional regulator